MTPKLKKIIIVIVAIIVVLFAYYMFVDKKEDDSFLVTSNSSEMSEKNKILGQKITRTLVQIKDIKLDSSIFKNEVFLSLIDRRVNIDKQTAGRKNPFAPLSDTSVNYKSVRNPEVGDDSNGNTNSVRNMNVTTGTTTATSTSTRSTTTSTSTRPNNSTTTVQ